jgi:hypothetical protein
MIGTFGGAYSRMVFSGILGILTMVSATGCGNPLGTVTGKVYYKNEPLKGGTVVFVTVDGKTGGRSDIAEDGSYSIADLPVGEVRIAVETRSLKPNPLRVREAGTMPKNAPSEAAGYRAHPNPDRYVAIPDRYAEIESSELLYTVIAGKQEYRIDLN